MNFASRGIFLGFGLVFLLLWLFCFGAFCCFLFVWGFLGRGEVEAVFSVHLKKLFVILPLVSSRARVSGIEGFKADSIGLRG